MIDCHCGSSYCDSCIRPLYEEKRPCPLCYCSFTSQIPNPHLKRTLNGLMVYCSFRDDGCQWRGELYDLEDHLNDSPRDPPSRDHGCKFVQVECCFCENKFQRLFIEEHEDSECSKRIFCCVYCSDYESTFEDVTENHYSVCPSRPVSCPNVCGETPLYKDLSEHLTTSCPLQMVDCCFSYAGCEAKVLRRDMEAHVGENIVMHMCLQGASHQQQLLKLKSQVSKLQRENDKLKHQIDRLVNDQTSMELQSQIVPIHLIMKRFTSRKESNQQWASPPIYTHLHGYKFQLIVDPNGARGNSISVYTELMRGPFDDELVDQGGEMENHTGIINYDEAPIEHSCRVTSGESNASWGITKFISNEQLSPRFLKNDSLHFRITQVDSE